MKKVAYAVALVVTLACQSHRVPAAQFAVGAGTARTSEQWLGANLARFHARYDVYSDGSAAGNHFAARGRMYGDPLANDKVVMRCASEESPSKTKQEMDRAEQAVPAMEEDIECPGRPGTCIRASFHPSPIGHSDDWGGWYFMNGVFPACKSQSDGRPVAATGQGAAPGENWGAEPDAGVDLTGATSLSFWARGERGGEAVDFFALGVGRDELGIRLPGAPGADSSPRTPPKERAVKKLARDWRQYTIDLKDLTLPDQNLRQVLGGFGWVTAAKDNRRGDVVFYLDDISYDLPRKLEPRFPLSFETDALKAAKEPFGFDSVTRNTAFTYDAAVALIAFVASGDLQNAKLIADALVYAQNHDRWYDDGRLRNAYQAGDLFLPPGWLPERNGWDPGRRLRTVRMPGW